MKRELSIALGKLILAGFWADGVLQQDEIDYLRNFLSKIPALSEEDILSIYLYAEYPVTPEEAAMISKDFHRHIASSADKQIALTFIDNLLAQHDTLRQAEKVFYISIKADIEGSSNRLRRFSRKIKKGVGRKNPPLPREEHLDDYLYNPLYFRFLLVNLESWPEGMDETSLRKLALEVAMSTRVLTTDGAWRDEHKGPFVEQVCNAWGVDVAFAEFVIDHALAENSDRFPVRRLAPKYQLFTTTEEQSRYFLGLVSCITPETRLSRMLLERVRIIGQYLNIDQAILRDVIAKLKQSSLETAQGDK